MGGATGEIPPLQPWSLCQFRLFFPGTLPKKWSKQRKKGQSAVSWKLQLDKSDRVTICSIFRMTFWKRNHGKWWQPIEGLRHDSAGGQLSWELSASQTSKLWWIDHCRMHRYKRLLVRTISDYPCLYIWKQWILHCEDTCNKPHQWQYSLQHRMLPIATQPWPWFA